VINPNGIVERVWEGAYYGKVKAEIEHTFGFPLATLPEIAQGIRGPQ